MLHASRWCARRTLVRTASTASAVALSAATSTAATALPPCASPAPRRAFAAAAAPPSPTQYLEDATRVALGALDVLSQLTAHEAAACSARLGDFVAVNAKLLALGVEGGTSSTNADTASGAAAAAAGGSSASSSSAQSVYAPDTAAATAGRLGQHLGAALASASSPAAVSALLETVAAPLAATTPAALREAAEASLAMATQFVQAPLAAAADTAARAAASVPSPADAAAAAATAATSAAAALGAAAASAADAAMSLTTGAASGFSRQRDSDTAAAAAAAAANAAAADAAAVADAEPVFTPAATPGAAPVQQNDAAAEIAALRARLATMEAQLLSQQAAAAAPVAAPVAAAVAAAPVVAAAAAKEGSIVDQIKARAQAQHNQAQARASPVATTAAPATTTAPTASTASAAAAPAAAAAAATSPVETAAPAEGRPRLAAVARANPHFKGTERAVPASPLARFMGFGSLAARLAAGTVADKASSVFSSSDNNGSSAGSALLTPRNMERLVEGLCRMRGAALKIGQMLSIQDESLLSPELAAVMARVRQGADVMPRAQLEAAMAGELGADWRTARFAEFEDAPIAAASIGQVHRAALHSGELVAVKVQYPGVARSINSDIDNLTKLLTMVNLTPRGLYLDQAMSSGKMELTLECDYAYEAAAQSHFKDIIDAEPALRGKVYVPAVFPSASSQRVLTTELVRGVPIDKIALPGADGALPPAVAAESGLSGSGFRDPAAQARTDAAAAGSAGHLNLSQDDRNALGALLMRVTLRELFTWRFMQTDPNWSNFLYDPATKRVNLIDFGASRRYKKAFVDEYLRMVRACGAGDRAGIIDASLKMGFLTGDETTEMMDLHVATAVIVGEPFGTAGPYDFVKGNIAGRVGPLAGKMVQSRLAAPPMEAYTLHRKLSGAFLTLRRLGAVVDVNTMFKEVTGDYVYGPESAEEEEISRRFK